MNTRALVLLGIVGAVLYYVLSKHPGTIPQFTGARGGTLPVGTTANSGLHAATPFGVYSGGTPFESGIAGLVGGLANIFHQQNQAQVAVPQGGTGGSSPGSVSLDAGGNFQSYAGTTGATTYAQAIAQEKNPLNAPIIGSGTTVAVVPQGPSLPPDQMGTSGAPDINAITPDQGSFFSSGFFGTSLDTPAPPALPTASLSFDSTTGSINTFFDPTSENYGLPFNDYGGVDYLSAAAAAPAPVG